MTRSPTSQRSTLWATYLGPHRPFGHEPFVNLATSIHPGVAETQISMLRQERWSVQADIDGLVALFATIFVDHLSRDGEGDREHLNAEWVARRCARRS